MLGLILFLICVLALTAEGRLDSQASRTICNDHPMIVNNI